jgi:hypothetical protein
VICSVWMIRRCKRAFLWICIWGHCAGVRLGTFRYVYTTMCHFQACFDNSVYPESLIQKLGTCLGIFLRIRAPLSWLLGTRGFCTLYERLWEHPDRTTQAYRVLKSVRYLHLTCVDDWAYWEIDGVWMGIKSKLINLWGISQASWDCDWSSDQNVFCGDGFQKCVNTCFDICFGCERELSLFLEVDCS